MEEDQLYQCEQVGQIRRSLANNVSVEVLTHLPSMYGNIRRCGGLIDELGG